LHKKNDSECSDDWRMYWFYNDVCFCVYVLLISRNNASIFNFGIFFYGKINLFGVFEKWNFPIILKSAGTTTKNVGNGKFYEKLVFEEIDFDFWCKSKKNDGRCMIYTEYLY